MKKTNRLAKVLSVVILFVLIAAMALNLTACKTKEPEIPPASSSQDVTEATRVGSGATEFAFRVTLLDGSYTDFVVSTDKKMVGEALFEVGLIEGEEGPYGLFVKKVNGIVADFDIDKTYWAFYVDGQYGTSGVDKTEIEPGKVYEFRVSK